MYRDMNYILKYCTVAKIFYTSNPFDMKIEAVFVQRQPVQKRRSVSAPPAPVAEMDEQVYMFSTFWQGKIII